MNQQQQQHVQNPLNSIYVGNIAWRTTEQEIGDTFANFGYVNSVKIITDKETGRSKGFGFVEFAERTVIPGAIQQMNGYNLNGRQLRVNQATGVKQQQNNFNPNMNQMQQQGQFNNPMQNNMGQGMNQMAQNPGMAPQFQNMNQGFVGGQGI